MKTVPRHSHGTGTETEDNRQKTTGNEGGEMEGEKTSKKRRARPVVDEAAARALLAALDRRLTRRGFRLREVKFRRPDGAAAPDIAITYDDDWTPREGE